MEPTLFLDRDGTLNVNIDDGYVTRPEELELIPGVAAALIRAQRAGFKLAIITNQQGIGKGLYTAHDLVLIHRKLEELVREETGEKKFEFDVIEFCPHLSGNHCACRKPKPEMVLRAAHALKSDLSRSWYVGDKDADLLCAHAAGVKSILVRTGCGAKTEQAVATWSNGKPTIAVDDLSAAVDWILASN